MHFSFFALFALASQFFMPSVAHADETKRVHIEASEPMRLEGRSYGSWIKVCDAPCDAKLRVVDVRF